MDDRPSASIWGTILSCFEIALNVYQVVAVKGEGLMIPNDKAEELLGEKALFQGKAKDGFVHFDKGSPGETAAAYELIKDGHITDPEVIAQYGTPEEIEADGRFLNPDYFGGLPEPDETPWGTIATKTPIDNGVYFLSTGGRSGIAVHKTVSEYCMSEHAHSEDRPPKGDYYFYDLNGDAAIAVFELSFVRPKVLELITSWESLMQTLAAEFPDYTDHWNHQAGQDAMICDRPAPLFMFLQQQLDQAAKAPVTEAGSEEAAPDQFFEQSESFEPER